MSFSISKNMIVEVRSEDSNIINWFSMNWGGGLKLNDHWALFTNINVVNP